MTTGLTNEEKETAGMTTHNKESGVEEQVEELRNKYKLKDNTIYCADDSEFCTDVKQALHKAKEEGRRGAVGVGVLMERERIDKIVRGLFYIFNEYELDSDCNQRVLKLRNDITKRITQDTVHNSKK